MKHIIIELKWAVIFAFSTMLWAFVEKSLGWHDALIADYFTNSLFFAFIAIGIYAFAFLDKRKNYFKYKMGFINGIMSGTILSIFIAIFTLGTTYLIANIISPNFLANIKTHLIESGKFTKQVANEFYTYKNFVKESVFGALRNGFLTSAFISGIFYLIDKGR